MKTAETFIQASKYRLMILAALFVIPVFANAGAIDQFRHFVVNTRAASGTFAQLQVKQEAEGKIRAGVPALGDFQFAKPGKFIWEYKKPYEQVLQSDGKTLYIYDKDLNQVTTRKLDAALGASPAAILFGSEDIGKNFNLRESGTRDNLEWLEATPKDAESTFQRINIGMKNNIPVAMELYDALGQLSIIKLTKFDNNPSVKPDTFKFVMPKGADVFNS